MIWNDSVLFIHAPKTAGMSMTSLLSAHLKGQVNVTSPVEKQYREDKVVYLPGKRHETLIEAASTLIYRNLSLEHFEKIFVVMRNPYDLELSRYSYLQKISLRIVVALRILLWRGTLKSIWRQRLFLA